MTLAEFVLLFTADTKGLARGLKTANTALGKTARFVRDNRQTFADLGRGAAIAGAAVSGALALGVRSAVRFETQMAFVSTMVKDTNRWMGEFSEAIREMAVRFGQSTDTLASGLFDILSAGVEAEKALGVLEVATMTAVGGFTRAEVTTGAMLTALKAFRLEAEDTTHIADVMFSAYERGRFTIEQLSGMLGIVSSTAATAGLSFEETAAALATITRTGVPAEMTATALNAAITLMRGPAEAATKAAKELGIGFDDAAVRERGFLGVLEDVIEASPTEPQLKALFPNVRARKAIDAIRLDMEGFRSDVEAAYKSTGLAAQSYSKATDTTAFRMKQLRQTIEEFLREVGYPLLEMVGSWASKIKAVLERLDEISPGMKDFAVKATAIAGALALILGGVSMLISRLPAFATQLGLIMKISKIGIPALGSLNSRIGAMARSSKLAGLGIGALYGAIIALTAYLVTKAIAAFKEWRSAVKDAREAQEALDDILSKAPEDFMAAAAASKAYRDQGVKNIKDIKTAIQEVEAGILSFSAEEQRAALATDHVRAAVMSRRRRRDAIFLKELRAERDQRTEEEEKAEKKVTKLTKEELEERSKALVKTGMKDLRFEDQLNEWTREQRIGALKKMLEDERIIGEERKQIERNLALEIKALSDDVAQDREESIRRWLRVYTESIRAGVEAFKMAQDEELERIKTRKETAIEDDFEVRRTVIENAEMTNEERQRQLEALIEAERKAKDAIIFTDKEMVRSRRIGAKAMLGATLDRIISEVSASAIGAIADATFKGPMTLGVSLLAIPAIIAAELGLKAALKGLLGSFQKGGLVPMTGPYMLHKGEMVVPSKTAAGVAVTVNIGPVAMTSDLDVENVANRVGQIIAQKIRRRRRVT